MVVSNSTSGMSGLYSSNWERFKAATPEAEENESDYFTGILGKMRVLSYALTGF